MPKKDEIDLRSLGNDKLMTVVLKTLREIHESSPNHTRTPFEEKLVEAACALLPKDARGVNPVELLAELRAKLNPNSTSASQ
ncbi:MAG: hypothetical protein LiPW15_439 [Parcubacteria group bacterium LiPW_15]|nr:MAG: hypothetical protein LiPW15_439 [Parcubacteria group bacterium LiPW_15]